MGGGLWLCRRLEFHVIAQIGVIISLSTNSTDDCPCSDRLGRLKRSFGLNSIKIVMKIIPFGLNEALLWKPGFKNLLTNHPCREEFLDKSQREEIQN